MNNILFDLDDTLISTQKNKGKILRELAESLGLPSIRDEEYLKVHAEFMSKGYLDTRYKIFQKILKSKGEKNPDKKATKLTKHYRKRILDELKILDDAYSALENLSNKFLGLVTNGPAITQREKIEKFGLEDYFDSIAISGEVGVAKPDPEIFWKVIDKNQRAKSVYVGNSRNDDVRSAKSAGLSSILVKRKFTEDIGPEATWEVKSLQEIPKIVSSSQEENLPFRKFPKTT